MAEEEIVEAVGAHVAEISLIGFLDLETDSNSEMNEHELNDQRCVSEEIRVNRCNRIQWSNLEQWSREFLVRENKLHAHSRHGESEDKYAETPRVSDWCVDVFDSIQPQRSESTSASHEKIESRDAENTSKSLDSCQRVSFENLLERVRRGLEQR